MALQTLKECATEPVGISATVNVKLSSGESHTHTTDLFVVTLRWKDVGSMVVQYGTVFVLGRIEGVEWSGGN
jgi:hypothetical protein